MEIGIAAVIPAGTVDGMREGEGGKLYILLKASPCMSTGGSGLGLRGVSIKTEIQLSCCGGRRNGGEGKREIQLIERGRSRGVVHCKVKVNMRGISKVLSLAPIGRASDVACNIIDVLLMGAAEGESSALGAHASRTISILLFEPAEFLNELQGRTMYINMPGS
jgi:hypothetical protein